MNIRGISCLLLTFFLFSGCDNTILPIKQSAPLVTDQEDFTRQIEVPSNVRVLEFHHQYGNISIVGWENPNILIEGVIRASAESVQLARSIIEFVDVIAYESPSNRLVLDYEGPAGFARGKTPEEGMDYTAYVPRDLLIDLSAEKGTVSVSEINSDVFIVHEEGDVLVESISGNATVEAEGIKDAGHRVSAKSIGRNLFLKTKLVDIEVEKVSGEIEIDHKKGEIRAVDIEGKVTLDGDDSPTSLKNIKGYIQVNVDGGDIVCDTFFDGIIADVRNGLLKLEPIVPVTRSYDCTVIRGNLIFRIPDESSMLLEITATNGSINSEYPLQVSAEGKMSYAKGAIGNGFPTVRLEAEKGSISILREIPSLGLSSSESNIPSGGSFESEPEVSTEGAIPVTDLESSPVDR